MQMIDTMGIKILAVAPVLAAADLPVGDWEKIGITGILIAAVIAIWRDGIAQRNKMAKDAEEEKKAAAFREERLLKVIEQNSACMATNAEVGREQTLVGRDQSLVLVEMKDVIKGCHDRSVRMEDWNRAEDRRKKVAP